MNFSVFFSRCLKLLIPVAWVHHTPNLVRVTFRLFDYNGQKIVLAVKIK